MDVELLSPNGSEGSAVFEIAGVVGPGSVTTQGDAYWDHGPAVSRVVVILDGPGPIRFRLQTQDVATIPAVTVLQVAGGDDELRPRLSGYEVRVAPVEGGEE